MIYFIQGTQSGNIKIGYTKNRIESRLKDIQSESSDILVCLKTIDGKEKDETNLHKKFKHLWSHAEWFRPGKTLLRYIKKLPSSSNDGMIAEINPPWDRQWLKREKNRKRRISLITERTVTTV